jgi:hypothetical protein
MGSVEYWLARDERVRAASYYESVGYTRAMVSIEYRIDETTGAERFYWERVRAALDELAAA